jgi:adenylate cyclase
VGAADDVTAWLIDPATRRAPSDVVVQQLCERLVESGVPLWRFSTSERTLHPEVFVRNLKWRRGVGVDVAVRARELTSSPAFLNSPVAAVFGGLRTLRRRLAGAEAVLDYPVCRELRDAGGTDYLVHRLDLGQGVSFVSWATDREGGFSDDDVATLEGLIPALGMFLELQSAYFATRSLLEVYLGRDAAGRVLAGSVTRGAGETRRAALYYCDLRGFTAMSDKRPALDVVAVLDRYFERVVGPVTEHGGEVLKLIGDAVLAIFPVGDGGDEAACAAALHAALDALGAGEPLDATEPGLRFGVALHVGDVVYGNIGAKGRLDFTVIGAAVNEVVRVEALCKPLGTSLLLTSAFAARCASSTLRSLGKHELRGVTEPQEVFTLSDGA